MPLKKCFPCLRFRQNEEVITKLDCSNTFLTDVFPDVWQHERTLEELHLTSTRINSLPPQLFYCQSLRILMVNNNNLEAIPNAIGSLRHLNHLNFSRNLISNVPDSIKTCKNLTHLDLCCNNLQRLPDAITCLISLQELLLNETYLEFLPANFGRLTNLKILELRLNNLITLPKSMARLGNLQRIDIGGNEFTELPDVIGELKQLRELWIDFNQIRRISPNIAKLRELQHFEANGNLIDSIPNEISHWQNIEVFSMCTNNLESLPFSIGMMKSLVTLKCESNDLRELPDSISNLENLEELVLSHNKLLRLPSTIGMLRKLRFLFADGNEIRTLPDEICSCSNLGVLSVSRNKIIELPQNIGHLTKLKVLNLVNNYICHLPVSILSLVNLNSLWISDNQSQPLVPLQYLDASKKTKLTCFMLPQVGMRMQQDATSEYDLQQEQNYDANGLRYEDQTSEHQQLQWQVNSVNSALSSCASPSKRICFAEETTILNAVSQPHRTQTGACIDNENLTSNLDHLEEQQQQQHMGVRLMRSPTPYPKELRLMSRYVRNGLKQPHKLPEDNSNTKEPDVSMVDPSNCDTTNPAVGVHNSNSTLQLPNNHNDLYAAGSLHADINYVGKQLQQQQQQLQQQLQQPNPNNEQQFYAAYYIAPSNLNDLQTADIAHNYKIMPILPQTQENQQQQEQQPHFVPHYYNDDNRMLIQQPLLEPPPYHIACVYTKKTPEDLTMYDSMNRHQKQLEQQQKLQLLQQSFNNTSLHDVVEQQPPEQATAIDNFDSVHNRNSNFHQQQFNPTLSGYDHQNNVMSANQFSEEASRIVFESPAEAQSESIAQEEHQQLNDVLTQSPMDSNSKYLTNNEISIKPSISKKSTPWLFGVHKNPTVKQVTLKWENNIGFAIDEIPHKEGIYVSAVVPNTNAARLLFVNDKLLEIDGFDLTNIHINDARKIILRAGPSINIMLSRK